MAATVARAEGITNSQILRYMTMAQGTQEILLVYVSNVSGAPACATAGRFIMSSSAPHYKSTLAMVIASYHTQTTVTARGLGTCSVWSNTEDLSYVCPGTGC